MSDKLEKQVRTVGLSLIAFLGPLAHCRDVTSLSYFYRYCFGRSSSELAKLVPLPHSCDRPNCYSNGMHDFFLFPFLHFIGMYMSIVSFLAQTHSACRMLPFDLLNILKSRVNRHLLSVGSY